MQECNCPLTFISGSSISGAVINNVRLHNNTTGYSSFVFINDCNLRFAQYRSCYRHKGLLGNTLVQLISCCDYLNLIKP